MSPLGGSWHFEDASWVPHLLRNCGAHHCRAHTDRIDIYQSPGPSQWYEDELEFDSPRRGPWANVNHRRPISAGDNEPQFFKKDGNSSMTDLHWRGSFAKFPIQGAVRLGLELHQHRVAALCKVVAKRMGLSKYRVSRLADAAALHDIGKLFVPASYLEKSVKLEAHEFEVIRQHPLWGYDILSSCQHPVLRLAAVIALEHHENWDGTGYPYGLSGELISLEARIVRICDVYDALRDDRPYHPGISHEEAIYTIDRGDGLVQPRMFDPTVHRVFLECNLDLAEVFAAGPHRSADDMRRRASSYVSQDHRAMANCWSPHWVESTLA